MKIISNNDNLLNISINLVKNAEGFSEIPYLDTVGIRTIGYGFNMEAQKGVIEQVMKTNIGDVTTMSLEQAQQILSIILQGIDVSGLCESDSVNVHAVLTDMAYNLGIEQLSTFDNFLSLLNSDKEAAVADLTNTAWFEQVGERGVRNCLTLLAHNNYYLI